MKIKPDRLEKALQTLYQEGDKYIIKGKYIDFSTNVRLNYLTRVETPDILGFISFIMYDINDLHNILDRMQWQLELYKNDQMNISGWMGFTKLDIELFHIKINSILDYLGKILKRVSEYPDEVPDKSFSDLKKWLDKKEVNIKKLGEDLSDLFNLCEWFPDIKDIRDWDIHKGGEAVVFLDKERIVFQIYRRRYEKSIEIPEIMYNENIAYFDLYAGLYIG